MGVSMFSSKGFSLVEAVVAVVIGAIVVLAVGGLSERLVHHRTTTDSNSAAMSLAELQMEQLIANPKPNPESDPSIDCSASPPPQALCGGAPPGGLTHPALNLNASGGTTNPEYRVTWNVVNDTSAANSPLITPSNVIGKLVKKITVTVQHLRNPLANASVVTFIAS